MTDLPCLQLDVRGLEPPEPLEQTLQVAARLAPGQSLHMRIHREPFPLYGLLDDMGLTHRTRVQADGDFLVIIERPSATG